MGRKKKPSKSMQLILDSMHAGLPVHIDTVMSTKDMRMAQAKSAAVPLTDPYDPSRGRIQADARDAILALGSYSGKDADGGAVYGGAVKQGGEYHLMFGLPASGKSTIADQLSQASGSRIMDSDYAKEQIPEFDGGWGANAVHKESKRVLSLAMEQAMDKGENLVVPKLGTPPGDMIDLLKEARLKGYKVYAHCVDLSPVKAEARMIQRYYETGRYIPPDVAANEIGPGGENKVIESFRQVVDSGICDGWTLWSNDVPRGEKPVLLGYGPNPDESIQALIQDAEQDPNKVLPKTEETEAQRDARLDAINDAIDAEDKDALDASEALKRQEREAQKKAVSRQQNGGMLDRLMSMLQDQDSPAGKHAKSAEDEGPTK